jgi:ribonuclease P protein component
LPATQKLNKPSFYRASNFSLKVSSNNLDLSRFGFVVRKSVDKRAVVRNRARRVFRSCIEEMLSGINQGLDMLFVLEKGIIGKEREEILQEIKKLLSEKSLSA